MTSLIQQSQRVVGSILPKFLKNSTPLIAGYAAPGQEIANLIRSSFLEFKEDVVLLLLERCPQLQLIFA